MKYSTWFVTLMSLFAAVLQTRLSVPVESESTPAAQPLPQKLGLTPPPLPTNPTTTTTTPCGACRLWASSLFFHPGSAGTRGQGHSTEHGAVLRLPETKVHVLLDFCSQREIVAEFSCFFCFLFLKQLLSKLFVTLSAAVIEAEHVWSTNPSQGNYVLSSFFVINGFFFYYLKQCKCIK